jgi:hypothetical protein
MINLNAPGIEAGNTLIDLKKQACRSLVLKSSIDSCCTQNRHIVAIVCAHHLTRRIPESRTIPAPLL